MDPKQIKSMKLLSNVKSIDDVLSVLSAKSPKFQARQITDHSDS